MRNIFKKAGVVLAGTVATLPVYAADASGISALTSAIDFSDVITEIVAVAGSLATVYVMWKAASLVLRAIRGL